MLPVIPKPPISRAQKAAALAVAGVVDLIQVGGLPIFGEGFLSPFQDALDFLTALLLMAICGFKWQFVLAFMLELVPIVDIFPTWTALVLTLPSGSPEHAFPLEVTGNVQAGPPPPAGAGAGAHSDVIDVEAVVLPPVQPQEGKSPSSP